MVWYPPARLSVSRAARASDSAGSRSRLILVSGPARAPPGVRPSRALSLTRSHQRFSHGFSARACESSSSAISYHVSQHTAQPQAAASLRSHQE